MNVRHEVVDAQGRLILLQALVKDRPTNSEIPVKMRSVSVRHTSEGDEELVIQLEYLKEADTWKSTTSPRPT